MPRALFKSLLPLSALLVITPLLLHGVSCGHDLDFHLLSWIDAAQQLRHGTLYPRWAFTPAWNAGEPRFTFYPPLSWMLGALLTFAVPIAAAPVVYIYLCLLGAAFAMYRLAAHFASPHAALVAAAIYIANPYMLFNAFERTAFAELLAAAWMPLLLLAVLRKKPTVCGIAFPLALLWLTNAPAAVMGSYLLALLATVRVAAALRSSVIPTKAAPWPRSVETPVVAFRLASTYILGTLLGLALPAFYLVPAAYERRYVQVAMAIIPNMRFQDNFLFDHTADAPHNAVNLAISLVAVTILAATVLAISVLLLPRRGPFIPHRAPSINPNSSSTMDGVTATAPNLIYILALLTIVIAFLLVPISTPVWSHLPNLAYLQFPWRLLTILSVVLCLALALLLHHFATRTPLSATLYPALAVLCPLAFSFLVYAHTAQGCEPFDTPTGMASIVATHHGVPPTDEYTPTQADNDVLRTSNPGYWLASLPDAAAPGTQPNPAQLNPNFDERIPLNWTVSERSPQHIVLNLKKPSVLVLNLRDYPSWSISRSVPNYPEKGASALPRLQRDDGLVAVTLPAGPSIVDIRWQLTRDQQLGYALTSIALLALAVGYWSRSSL